MSTRLLAWVSMAFLALAATTWLLWSATKNLVISDIVHSPSLVVWTSFRLDLAAAVLCLVLAAGARLFGPFLRDGNVYRIALLVVGLSGVAAALVEGGTWISWAYTDENFRPSDGVIGAAIVSALLTAMTGAWLLIGAAWRIAVWGRGTA